jgi:hypothetical protein
VKEVQMNRAKDSSTDTEHKTLKTNDETMASGRAGDVAKGDNNKAVLEDPLKAPGQKSTDPFHNHGGRTDDRWGSNQSR